MENKEKEFKQGDKVIYPLQYVGEIKDIETVNVLNKEEEYYVIETAKLSLKVPVKKVSELGIRKIVNISEVEDVYKILKGKSALPITIEGDKWIERYEELKNRVKFGDVLEHARVVRDLQKNDVLMPLNQMEKELLRKARKTLIEELMETEQLPRKKVQLKVNACLKENIKRDRI